MSAHHLIANRMTSVVLVCYCGLLTVPTFADDEGGPKSLFVKSRNDQSPFTVGVSVDRADMTYRHGEKVKVSVVSSRAGYLYLFYLNSKQEMTCVFPNAYQQKNKIEAQQKIQVPSEADEFDLIFGETSGTEYLKALVTDRPLNQEGLQNEQLKWLQANNFHEVNDGEARSLNVVLRTQKNQWAEHFVKLNIIDKKEQVPDDSHRIPDRSKRVALCVGVGDYIDNFPRLATAENDAKSMQNALKTYVGVKDSWLLLNDQATLKNVEEHLTETLPANTNPGDTIIIYWSGHTGVCRDRNGDEADRYDEFLVPYDGLMRNREESMLLDDTFSRWVQLLKGRKLILILEASHPNPRSTGTNPAENVCDFLDEFHRVKFVNQRGTALLVSCQSHQKSFPLRKTDQQADAKDPALSVMTSFLLEYLKQEETATLQKLHTKVHQQVSNYTKQHWNSQQTPVLFQDLEASFEFKRTP